MIGSREKVFAAIRGVLAEQVLNELKPKTWMASNIRACLALLAYAEDLVAQDEAVLTETNAALREFLQTLAARHPAWLDAALAHDLRANAPAETDIAALEAQNQALRALLVRIIRAHRDAGGKDVDFTVALHPLLLLISTRDAEIAARAAAMPPL
jgi:hypothetical protein